MMNINYQTDFTHFSAYTLNKLFSESKLEAGAELILRSPYNDKLSISKQEAIRLAKKGLQQDPQHIIFNFILGLYHDEKGQWEEAIKYFKQAHYQPNFGNIPIIRHVANCYYAQEDFLHAAVWQGFACLRGDELAKTCYFKGRFSNSMPNKKNLLQPFEMLVFLLMVFSDNKIEDFHKAKVLADMPPGLQNDFLETSTLDNALSLLDNEDSAPAKITRELIALRPKDFLTYFTVCYEEKVINDKIYERILNYFIYKTTIPHLRDEALYRLFILKIKNNSPDALLVLNTISFNFKNYSLKDIESFTDANQDFFSTCVFDKLFYAQFYDKAFVFLTHIKDPSFYSVHSLDIFSAEQAFTSNYDLIVLKKTILFRLMERISIYPFDFAEKIKKEYNPFVHPQEWTKMTINCVLSLLKYYLDERKKRVRNHKIRYFLGESIHKDGIKRERFVDNLEAMFKGASISTFDQGKAFLDNLAVVLHEGEILFRGEHISPIFSQAKTIVKDAILQLQTLALNKPSEIANQTLLNIAYPDIHIPSFSLNPDLNLAKQNEKIISQQTETISSFSLYPQILYGENQEVKVALPVLQPASISYENDREGEFSSSLLKYQERISVDHLTQQIEKLQIKMTGPVMGNLIDLSEDLVNQNENIASHSERNQRISAKTEIDIEGIKFPEIPNEEPKATYPTFFNKQKDLTQPLAASKEASLLKKVSLG